MKKIVWFLLVIFVLSPLAYNGNPQKDPQKVAKIEELKQEIIKTKTEIEEAQKKDSERIGGLVKTLITVRIEILKTNEALMQQMIYALESGAPIKLQVSATTPDEQKVSSLEQEIQVKKDELAQVKKEMDKYSGGLVLAIKSAEAATLENTIAMLDQQRIISKYGLSYDINKPKIEETSKPSGGTKQNALSPAEEIFVAKVLNKGIKGQEYNKFLWFDLELIPNTLKKPTRSVKGILLFCDLFGEMRFQISGTFNDKITPEASYIKKGIGTDYNRFLDDLNWLKDTDLKDMTFRFRVVSIIYEDGERVDY